MCTLLCSCAFPVYYPGLEGRIIDAETRLPIKDAYIICIDYDLEILKAINPGGGSPSYSSIHICKTDTNGYFKLNRYIAYTVPSDDLRRFFVYKFDYYSHNYFQTGFYTFKYYPVDGNHIDISKEYFENMYLKKRLIDNEGQVYSFGTTAHSVLSYVYNCAEIFGWYDKNKFKEFKPVFEQIYSILNSDSDKIRIDLLTGNYTSDLGKRALESWDTQLKDLKDLIDREN